MKVGAREADCKQAKQIGAASYENLLFVYMKTTA